MSKPRTKCNSCGEPMSHTLSFRCTSNYTPVWDDAGKQWIVDLNRKDQAHFYEECDILCDSCGHSADDDVEWTIVEGPIP